MSGHSTQGALGRNLTSSRPPQRPVGWHPHCPEEETRGLERGSCFLKVTVTPGLVLFYYIPLATTGVESCDGRDRRVVSLFRFKSPI